MVSIIIPTYNRGNVIKRSIDSVLVQTYRDFELIIVDDASEDDTKRRVDEYNNPRIRYIRNINKLGANGARNVGIQNAKGEYVAFQDSDDFWEVDKLEKQINFLDAHGEIDIVYSRYKYYWINGEVTLIPDKNFTNRELQEKIGDTLARSNVIGTPTMVVRKRCFDEVGIFDEAIPRFQDWEIAIRLVERYKFSIIDEVLVRVYETEKSITKVKENELTAMLLIVNKHRKFFEENGTLIEQLEKIFAIAFAEKRLEELFGAIDQGLFVQGLYAHENKKNIMKRNIAFIKEWMKKGSSEVIMNKFFEQYTDKRIAIYGMGELGRLLLDILTDENKQKIEMVIERNLSIASEYRLRRLEDLNKKELEKLECIIITSIAHEREIKRSLRKITSVRVSSLSDIIESIHYNDEE